MAEGDQVSQGDQGQGVAGSGQDNLGWRSALPDEFKQHEWVKTFTKPGDFVKAAVDLKTAHADLEGKSKGAIFKPGKDAKPEDVAAYRKAMGVPENPEEYEFPKGEGVEHDEKLTTWAKGIFHKAGLSGEQASVISQAWDAFLQGMAEADAEAEKTAQATAVEALKAKWGADFDKNLEFSKRGFRKFAGAEFDEWTAKAGIGKDPVLVEFLFNVGKAMGEDWSPKGDPPKGATPQIGMNYDMPQFK